LNLKLIAILKSLLSVEGIGPRLLIKLIASFSNPENVLLAGVDELITVFGINEITAKKISMAKSNYREGLKSTEIELENLTKIGAKIITYYDAEYPEILKNIYAPPIILYTLGDTSLIKTKSIAIVGTRNPSRYGIKQAERFSAQLAKNGLTITSGLARGIDSAAHKACLQNGGSTIAVVGSGLDWIYPPENKALYRNISEAGLIISEYSLGVKPDGKHFPQRNRIIAGLSLGTLVVETKSSGGALNTAAIALTENREVFAIPGNLGIVTSEGTNRLIQKGEAKLVIKVEDILEELNLSVYEKSSPKTRIDISSLNLFEQKIIEVLTEEPQHIDFIARKSGVNSADCSIHLLSLEFKGLVEQLPGKYFVLV
jgi:DNA processing protein